MEEQEGNFPSRMDDDAARRRVGSADRDGKRLKLRHSFGIYPEHFRDSVIFVGDDSFLFCIGCHIVIYDLVKESVQFLPRNAQGKTITSMAMSANRRYLAVGEKSSNAEDNKIHPQISILQLSKLDGRESPTDNTTQPRSPTKQDSMQLQDSLENHSSHSFRTLNISSKVLSEVQCVAFTVDSKFLVSLTGSPDFTLSYWRWESEKLVVAVETKVELSRLQVNPKSHNQISCSGDCYLRFWEFSSNDMSLKEYDALLPLKTEKQHNFVDHCWVHSNFLVAASKSGSVFIFEDSTLKETVDVRGVAQESEEAAQSGPTLGRPPRGKTEQIPVKLRSVAPWGKGFVVGGDRGYVGVYQLDAKVAGNAKCLGTFWFPSMTERGPRPTIATMSAGVDDSYMVIHAYTEREGDDPATSAVAKSLSKNLRSGKWGAPGAEKAKRFWHLAHFPIGQADLALAGQTDVFTPVYPMGFHQDRIVSMDCCMARRVVATIAEDFSLKIWGYPSHNEKGGNFSSELTFAFSDYDQPISLSLHPLGFQVAVMLPDRLRVYHVTMDKVKSFFELPLRSPGQVAYSHSGEMLAVTSGTSVVLLDCWRAELIHVFSGHLSGINHVIFSEDDQLLMSCGSEGAIYGWDLGTAEKLRSFEHVAKGSEYECLAYDMTRQLVVCCTKPDGLLRVISHVQGQTVLELPDEKSRDRFNTTGGSADPHGSVVCYTAIKLAVPLGILLAGTRNGSIRLFRWPMVEGDTNPLFAEYPIHGHAVTTMSISNDCRILFSGCAGGALIATNIESIDDDDDANKPVSNLNQDYVAYRYRKHEGAEKKRREVESKTAELVKKLASIGQGSSEVTTLNEFLLVPKVFLSDKLQEIKELEERMENLKNDTEYTMVQKEQEMEEKLRIEAGERSRERKMAGEKYDELFQRMSKNTVQQDEYLKSVYEAFEREKKNNDEAYEDHLAQEYDKQNRLLQELQTVRNQHKQDLGSIERKYEDQILNLKAMQEKALHEWSAEYDRVCNLLKSDGLKFEEALRQQEDEYEMEIAEMMAQKRTALQTESEKSTIALKDMVSMKQQINLLQGQLKLKEEAYDLAINERNDLRQKLDEAIDKFRKGQISLKERDEVIKIKDESIQKLRDQQKHLESFRFVLFHKVQTLEEQRDPLEDQVNSLRQSVKDMYAEFVREFREKQTLEQRLNDKTSMAGALQNENIALRGQNQLTKRDLQRLFQDLQEILSSFDYETLMRRLQGVIAKYEHKMSGKKTKKADEEEAATADETSETMPLAMTEMQRQRDVLLKKCRAIADANVHVNAERSLDFKRMTSENSQLIAEMNQLRVEKGSYKRRVNEMETRLQQYERDASGPPGGLSHSSSAPNLPQSSMRSPEMRRQRLGDQASTPFVRRRMQVDDDTAHRQRQKELNQLPPVDPGSPPDPKPSPGSRRKRDLARASPAERELRDVLTSMAAQTESMEKQGFQMDRLRDISASSSGFPEAVPPLAASSSDSVAPEDSMQADPSASPADKKSAKRRPR